MQANSVLAGLVPAIHVFAQSETWIRGTSPRITEFKAIALPARHVLTQTLPIFLTR
jgi:hypothetical protein